MLELKVQKQLGAFRLDAEVAAGGRVTALFGRSGSGKTTLANVAAGLVKPDRGRVVLGGTVVFDSERGIDVAAHRRRVGYIFQEARLLPHLTVRGNLLYGYQRTPAAERTVELAEVVELLGIAHLLERRPAGLSGGEKQRVAIGRALLTSPRMLLMDEPLASLDNLRKAEILQYIDRLKEELNVPILYVSHAIDEVVRLADTVVVLSDGAVRAAGPVEEVMGRLDLRPLTGRYEGGAVIEARVVAQDLDFGLATLRFSGGDLHVANLEALVGEPVRVRVRARDVALALERPEGLSMLNVLAGTVAEIADEGGAIVDVRVQVGDDALISRITRRSLHDLGLAPGQPVYALIKAVALDRRSLGFM
ncbi:MAG TPA: molybdenum ABC transporter ATP-binding protein [Pelomicrobium sp.]|nr:molybdenum ABC transporter ATP-binding protein [Pelomicrobium sp.]